MDAATIENIAYELTKPHQQRLTGKLVIAHRNQQGKQWFLYFFLGRLLYATGGTHRVRRWYRALGSYCPNLSVDNFIRSVSANQLPNDEPWEYQLLDLGVTQDQIKPAQARAVIQTSIQKVLFGLISQPEDSLTSRWYPNQQLSCQIALFQVEQLLQEAQQLWEQWRSAGLGQLQELLWRFSPDLSPILKHPDQLQSQVSLEAYQTLTKLMDGQNTLWDAAAQMRRSVAVVTRSLLPFVQQGVIELREVPDLPAPALGSPSTSRASDSSKPLVACIADSPLIGQSLEKILTPAGYRVLNIIDPLRAIAALQANPQAALTIGQLVLENFYSAQAAFLGGDRIQGGSPSPALVEYGQLANRPNNPVGLFDADSGSLEAIFGAPFPADEAAVVGMSSPAPSPQFEVAEPSAVPDSDFAALEGIFDQSLPVDDIPEIAADDIPGTPETAVETIHQLFSQLPPATDLEPSDSIAPSAQPELSPTAASPAQPEGPAPVAAPASPGVRVDLVRLERLNNLVGELIIQENSLLLQNHQFQSIIQALMQRFNRFEDLTKNLRDWADRLTLGTQTLFSTSTTTNGSELGTDFDSLQMDSYSHLYTLAQTTVEEIAQIGEAMRDMTLLTQQSQQTFKQKQQTLKQVRNDLLWARMLPLGDILQRFPRMVRDLAGKKRKQVAVRLSGVNTLVDKAILEKLYDPLVHLVRNAFDHGIESPEIRQAQGKPSQGTIEIRAYHRGNQIYIEIRDDGQGINLEKVCQRVIALNLLPAAEADTVTKGQLFEYLFAPGFSTAAQVSDLSGRGVGLDAVRLQVRALKGSVTITSEPGEGTTFTLRLPLTLTISKLLVFSANNNLMALPVDSLVAIIAAPESEIQTLQGHQFYRWQGQMVPLYPHSQFTYYYPLARDRSEQLQSTALPAKKIPLLLISGGSQVIALEIDQLLTEQELVIKPFGGAVAPPSYLYGCTILGDGRLVPVVDGPALVSQWLQPATPVGSIAPTPSSPMAPQSASTILVVDDSLTMRQTLSLTLQKKGYRVVQARDGREALDQLQQEPGVRAVFCDIEMPQMNGFEFLSHCRRKYPSQSLPVIMLTSRSGEKHRQLARQLRATDYLTKPYLEQELLRTLQNCLGQLASLSS